VRTWGVEVAAVGIFSPVPDQLEHLLALFLVQRAQDAKRLNSGGCIGEGVLRGQQKLFES